MRAIIAFVRRLHENSNLFQKVLIANATILAVGAIVGTWLTLRLASHPDYRFSLHVVFTAIGIYASVLVNYFLLKLAFQPLFSLQATMEDIQAGDFNARTPHITGDPDIARLAQTFNLMLDRLGEHRRSVSRQILQALEDERRRISRELHDESGQSLTTLVILLEQLLAQLPDEDTEKVDTGKMRDGLRRVRDLAVSTLDEIHKLMYDLRPTILDDLGLIPAIRWYANDKLKPLGFRVNLNLPDSIGRLPDHVETTLFRVVQESITNIIKHANASEVNITVSGDAEFISAEVIDNGRGFDVDRVMEEDPQQRGLGLFGMHERVDLTGGSINISSAPGAGTKVLVKIPRTGRKEY